MKNIKESSENLVELDLNGPLINGTEVLEASAGTGKTYALSHRVLRAIAEQGRTVDSILVVTFTRAAAAEIRRRIRARLDLAATALAMAIGENIEAAPPSIPPWRPWLLAGIKAQIPINLYCVCWWPLIKWILPQSTRFTAS